jgi:sulfofructose kinase
MSEYMKKILCIGHSSYDITIPLESFPIENQKYRVDKIVECGGGPANNAAYLLSKWGMKTYYAGIVGNDNYGKIIIEELKQAKVNIKYLEINKQHETSVSYILVNSSNGSRTLFNYAKGTLKMKNKVIKMKPDIILVDGHNYETALNTIKSNPQAISIIDAGRYQENSIELYKKVNYLVCSKNFAEDFTNMKIDPNNQDNINMVYDKLSQIFNNNIIVTVEDKGCIYKKDNQVKIMPSINVIPKDTTGAGDIFHGAFTYGVANNYDLEKNLKLANITGALSTTKIGSKKSIPNLEQVMKVYNS